MFQRIKLRTLAAALVLGSALAAAGTAGASDCYAPRCHWKTVIDYVSVEKPYIGYVTRYDHCGHPYLDRVVKYRYVRVPVERHVKVCY